MASTKDTRFVRLDTVARTTLTEAVFQKLVGHIVEGDWKEGDRLPPERDLSEQLGIGRASLREALKALELVGILESRVGDGTFVCPRSEFLSRPLLWAITGTDRSELRDLVEARRILEEDIAALAAERAAIQELARIKAAVADLRAHIDDSADALEADMRFHVAIAEAAHNQILLNAVQLLRNLMRHWLLLKLQLPSVATKVLEQHERIYLAIHQRDADQAREEMRTHLLNSSRLLIDLADRQS